MRLSNIANVFDVEHDNGRLIEIGLTTVSLKDRQILQSYSIPIKPDFERLGHHKRNSYVPTTVIKNLLKHVGITFEQWLDAIA